VKEQSVQFGEIAKECGGGEFAWAIRPEERNRLWQARHDVYWASQVLRPGARVVATDVCVPISRLAECVVESIADVEAAGLLAPVVGHVGDGNFHLTILVDPDGGEDLRVHELLERLSLRAIAMDGTCTGEHGIGQGKIKYLEREHGTGMDVMWAIKRAIDPKGIMNPGKIFKAA
jgi:D-lactate dehydrogenase (cytochrome)